MTSTNSEQQISKEDFDFFDGAIRNDIPGSIAAKANFLTALGLVSYTEFLGAILNGQLGVLGKSEENFNVGFYAMGQAYEIFDRQVVAKFGKSFYKIFRCGLVH